LFSGDDNQDYYANQFLDLLQTFSLKQYIDKPTHKDGHTLDLVITKSDSNLVSDFHVSVPWISDHSIIQFKLTVEKPSFIRKTISFHKWKSMDVDQFKQGISDANLLAHDSVSSLTKNYNQTMRELVEKYAPLITKTITERPHAEWYTSKLEKEKRTKRMLERRYVKTLSWDDAHRFNVQCAHVSDLLVKTRETFYSEQIKEQSGNQKGLFKVFNKLLHRTVDQPLPTYDSLEELVNRFADSFEDKIKLIRLDLQSARSADTTRNIEMTVTASAQMCEFKMVTESDVERIIMKSATKSCSLDPLPTWLLKECLSSLLPILTKIINLSLSEGEFPANFKEAILTPLLKKIMLDPDILKHFRPVSNLQYVSKLVEKVVDIQTTMHMKDNNMDDVYQSSYKIYHSTETAMLRLHNDILWALDQNKAVLLICLDLSAAFDTVDHQILLNRLEKHVGITGKCLSWYHSYLTNRKQSVVIHGVSSTVRDLSCGVPQGSVVGPKLFNIYMLPAGDIAKKHGVDHLFYADDKNLWIAFRQKEVMITLLWMEALIVDLREWLGDNWLMCNNDKTGALVINGPRRQPIDFPPLSIGDAQVLTSFSQRVLGFEVDECMNMKKQVNAVTKSCFYELSKMYKVRKCVTEEAAKTMVHTLVTSRLDYCNALLFGLPDCLLNKLWCVQKSSARLITMTRKYDHISPVMEDLHWLPIWQRIDYKVLLLSFKSLNGLAPQYLSDLLQRRPDCGTRRDHTNLLVNPRVNRITFGGRAFKKAAPELWNAIPEALRLCTSVDQFKRQLKTRLCRLVYGCSC